MAKETFTSDEVKGQLKKLADEVKRKYGISVWFAEIIGGRRWSFIAGNEDETAFLPPARFKLSDNFGIVIESSKEIPEEVKHIITSELKRILSL